MNRLTFSAASWLSKSNKKRQWNIISSSIASAASKEDKKEEKKGGGGGDKKKKSEVGGGGGGDASMKARTESLEKFIQTAEKAKRYVLLLVVIHLCLFYLVTILFFLTQFFRLFTED